MIREGEPPGNLKQSVEPMLEFTTLACLDFYARLLSIEPVEHAYDQRKDYSGNQVPCHKKDGRRPRDDVAKES